MVESIKRKMILLVLLLLERLTIALSSIDGNIGSSIEALNWIVKSEVQFHNFIDSGKFSDVYAGSRNGKQIIVKVLKTPVSVAKVSREIQLLEQCADIPEVIQLEGVIKEPDAAVALVFESVGEHHQWLSHKGSPMMKVRDLSSSKKDKNAELTAAEIKFYIYKVLVCLESLHRRGVMHRDLKSRNIILDRMTQNLKIIDFGHAEYLFSGRQYSHKVGSRHYKAPELLLNYKCYDSAIDIWACGCILAGLIFKLEPFFYARPDPLNLRQLQALSRVLGSMPLTAYCKKYGIKITEKMKKAIGASHRRVPLKYFRTEENVHLCDDLSIDLVEKMLCVDHQRRLTVEEALAHPYFDACRSAKHETKEER
jgi:casein kinase II subunit alpha